MEEYIEKSFPRKIEDFSELRPYLMNTDSDSIKNNQIFRNFRDRFKTWEQLKVERYLC